jgi:two-component system response regulator YcbB
VDDDDNIVLILKNIIKKQNLGEVIGFAYDGKAAYEEILDMKPDIVLLDYLMPKIDGATLVNKLKKENEKLAFIMISQVTDTKMVTDVYNEGIEFFIHKPINIVEVERVIRSVTEKVELMKKFEALKGLFTEDVTTATSGKKDNKKTDDSNEDSVEIKLKKIQRILSEIGIVGEKGTSDILKICEYKIENETELGRMSLNEICEKLWTNPKIVKQRMRRTIAVGLRNLANLGIEDNLNEYYLRYANTLYDFEAIRNEMEMTRGKSSSGGRANTEKFIENLIVQTEEY